MKTKERLRREVTSWIKRAEHEANLAFAEGDLWRALAWGSKIPQLAHLLRGTQFVAFESGPAVDLLFDHVDDIVRSIDFDGSIRSIALGAARMGHLEFGIDFAMKGSAQAIATMFALEVDRIGRRSMRILDSHVLKSATDEDLDRIASRCDSEEEYRERMRGKACDLFILDDPLKE